MKRRAVFENVLFDGPFLRLSNEAAIKQATDNG